MTPPLRPPKKGLPGAPVRRTRRRVIEGIVIVVGCVLLLDALVGERGLIVMKRAEQANRSLEQHLDTLRSENELLKAQIQLLQHDRETIEDLARQKLGLIKPGEKVFTIRDIEPPAK